MKVSYEFYPPQDLDYKKVVNEFSKLNSYKPNFIINNLKELFKII